jgi:hypothetical protein
MILGFAGSNACHHGLITRFYWKNIPKRARNLLKIAVRNTVRRQTIHCLTC